jgi:hypothetical protein
MSTQRRSKHQITTPKPAKETPVAIKKGKIKKNGLTQAKPEERTRAKSKETLAAIQKALRAAQAKVKRERQARIRAEKALTEAWDDLAAARLEVKREPQAGIRRASFIVRLTIGEHDQFGRTEIEHVGSSGKQSFPSLDGERLVAFMKACISPISISEPTIPPIPSTEKGIAPIPEPHRPKSNVIVSEVRVLHLGDSDFTTLILTREEPFGLKASFQLQGPDAHFLLTQGSSFEIKLYANEITSGESKLLTTYSSRTIQDVLEYTTSIKVPGLRPGLYRLFTIVILSASFKMAGFYGKTVINVT